MPKKGFPMHTRHSTTWRGINGLMALLTIAALLLVTLSRAGAAPSYTVVTPNSPDGWQPANVRANATVGIGTSQPRGDAPNNLGSLEFTTNTLISGEDKADYAKYWGVVSGRTLGNISALSYELFRASSSTTAQHLLPAFRLAYATNEATPKMGYLIWEHVYNGGNINTPVPTDQWLASDMLAGNFWMRTFSPGFTVEQYGVTLADWASGATFSGSHQLAPDTNIIGVEVGVGSGWGGTFSGFADKVAISFAADSVTANFEPNPVVVQCTTDCYVDDDTGNDANGGTSFADAKQHIQAGIDQVSPGGTVHVNDGVYAENLLIGKPLTLEGRQHGVLAKDRAGAQSIVQALNSSVPVNIRADSVVIDGFVFDGSAAASQPWIMTALNEPGNGRYEKVAILNNEFRGNPGSNTFPGGMYMFNHDNLAVEGNYFNALGQHALFLAGSSTNAIYRNNDSYRNYNSNISTQDNTPSGHQNILIENNRAVEDDMILFNMRDATVRNNTITGGAYSTSRIWLGGGNNTVLISGNTFTRLQSTAVQVLTGFGYGSNSNLTVTGNTINTTVAYQNDNYSMIDFRDGSGTNLVDGNSVTLTGSYAAGGTATHAVGVRGSTIGTITISNNELNGGSVGSAGTPPSSAVLIRSNSASGALPSSAVITVANNFLKNFSNGVTVYDFVASSYGGLAGGVGLKISQNSITGNSANGVITGANDPIADAERNWWGSASGPQPTGTGDKATGALDYDPWLCSGTDTSGAAGFQPNPQTSPCVAPTGTLAVTKYNDLNKNHAKDAGEPGLSGWTITVRQGTTTVASNTTGSDGSVSFALAAGSYTVCETQQSGWTNTDPSDGSGCKAATVTAGSTTSVLLGNAASAPAACQVYGVNEVNSADNQFFSMTLGSGAPSFSVLGGVAKGYNIESLALHPTSGVLYAGSGDTNKYKQRAALYTVSTSTGALSFVGSTGLKELEALAFNPATNVLWGWGYDKGLVTINTSTGAATVVYSSKIDAEGMAWSRDGKTLYIAESKTLYSYDPATRKLSKLTSSLPGNVEALSLRPDGLLAVAVDGSKTLYAYDPLAKKEIKDKRITMPYKDVEGLAWPASCGA